MLEKRNESEVNGGRQKKGGRENCILAIPPPREDGRFRVPGLSICFQKVR